MKGLKLEELLLYLLENHTNPFLSFQFPNGVAENEFAIRKIVESNVTSNLTIDELAFLCNVSVSTFKRNFLKIYNTSPANWLLERKMKLAAQLIQEDKGKPSEIYYKLGYESHSSFTKSFKKFYGLAPKDYLKQKL